MSNVEAASGVVESTEEETPDTLDPEEDSIAASYQIPPLTEWCGIEHYNEEEDAWQHVEVPNLGKWWRPKTAHPVEVAERLWDGSYLPDGTYRAIFKPEDKRKTGTTGDAFELVEGGEESTITEEEREEMLEALGQEPNRGPTPTERARAEAPARRPGRTVPTVPARQGRQKEKLLRRPPLITPFDPPRPEETTPLAQLVYINGMAEAQRAREHQTMLQMTELMITTIKADAAATIAAEQSRCDQTIAWIRAGDSERRRTDLDPLNAALAQIQQQVEDMQQDTQAAQDASEEQIQQQLATLAQQPEGPQALIGAIGQFLQSPAGQLIADGLKKIISGEAQPPPVPPGGYDPGGM